MLIFDKEMFVFIRFGLLEHVYFGRIQSQDGYLLRVFEGFEFFELEFVLILNSFIKLELGLLFVVIELTITQIV